MNEIAQKRKEIRIIKKAWEIAKAKEASWKHVYQQPLDAKIGVQMDKVVKSYCNGEVTKKTTIAHTRHLPLFTSVVLICFRINPGTMTAFAAVGMYLILLACAHTYAK